MLDILLAIASLPGIDPKSSFCFVDSGLSIGRLTDGTDDEIKHHVFKFELPFYSDSSVDHVLDLSTDELLSNGHKTSKFATDNIIDYFSVKIVSSNAKQLSRMFQLLFGFEEIAYKGLETGSTLIGSHVVSSGNIVIEFINTLESILKEVELNLEHPDLETTIESLFGKKLVNQLVNDYANYKLSNTLMNCRNPSNQLMQTILKSREIKVLSQKFQELAIKTVDIAEPIYNDFVEAKLIQDFLEKHTDGVMDISFVTNDLEKSFTRAINGGAKAIRQPSIISDDFGSVKIATIGVPNTDLHHTMVENINYIGSYLPGFHADDFDTEDNLFRKVAHNNVLPEVPLTCIDHCVENYIWNQSLPQVKFYAEAFGFHKFWSVSDNDISTENSSLISIVMASSNGKIKIPINEPAKGKMRGQIEEFYDFHHGPGIQHIAFKTNNIISAVRGLKERGMEFNLAPVKYYSNLIKRMRNDDVAIRESMEEIIELGILVDYDASSRNKLTRKCNYILQIFTKPLHDRPTLFIEIIQRHHHNGFGKGTFKGLFETIEEQQKLRGTLIPYEDDEVNVEGTLYLM